MKEWDLDSYNRKWRGTYAVYGHESGKMDYGYLSEFFLLAKSGNKVGTNVIRDGRVTAYAIETENEQGYEKISLCYHPLVAGWYKHQWGYALLTRYHIRGFQIGVNTGNYACDIRTTGGDKLAKVDPFDGLDFLSEVQYTPYNFGKFGILSRKLWWGDGQLNFLGRAIGIFKKPDHLILEGPEYLPYIKHHMGDECQISC